MFNSLTHWTILAIILTIVNDKCLLGKWRFMKKLCETSKTVQIRISITEQQKDRLDRMAGDNNRAAFIRRAIDQEWNRRHQEEKEQERQAEQ